MLPNSGTFPQNFKLKPPQDCVIDPNSSLFSVFRPHTKDDLRAYLILVLVSSYLEHLSWHLQIATVTLILLLRLMYFWRYSEHNAGCFFKFRAWCALRNVPNKLFTRFNFIVSLLSGPLSLNSELAQKHFEFESIYRCLNILMKSPVSWLYPFCFIAESTVCQCQHLRDIRSLVAADSCPVRPRPSLSSPLVQTVSSAPY